MINCVDLTSVILAAGCGRRIQGLTERPKILLPIRGESLLERHLRIQKAVGIERVVIVVGYEKEQIFAAVETCFEKPEVVFVESEDFRTKGNGYSLWLGLQRVSGGALVFDGDLFYDETILVRFLRKGGSSAVLIGPGNLDDVECAKALVDARGMVRKTVDKRLFTEAELKGYRFAGEAIGVLRFDRERARALQELLQEFLNETGNIGLNWEHPLNRFLLRHDLSGYIEPSDQWLEIDDEADYQTALERFEQCEVAAPS
ncbi:MAG: Bifunctional IPC transferase and DIPP synthase [Verrucomicrobia subdivision 3 bacterium]|nr:Bifunctional IPC transferase and DIPP synthase [Limisphaerales bacterium]MCS1414875.1 Bifunctional IPC transferase and DIPP synthase [Limisphaerales bacterium]